VEVQCHYKFITSIRSDFLSLSLSLAVTCK